MYKQIMTLSLRIGRKVLNLLLLVSLFLIHIASKLLARLMGVIERKTKEILDLKRLL